MFGLVVKTARVSRGQVPWAEFPVLPPKFSFLLKHIRGEGWLTQLVPEACGSPRLSSWHSIVGIGVWVYRWPLCLHLNKGSKFKKQNLNFVMAIFGMYKSKCILDENSQLVFCCHFVFCHLTPVCRTESSKGRRVRNYTSRSTGIRTITQDCNYYLEGPHLSAKCCLLYCFTDTWRT